jgi:hypothetical protein
MPAEPPPIGLRNGLAIRIALSSCALSSLLAIVSGQLGMPPMLSMLWFVGAGFFAVFLYRMRTGRNMSALNGAALGWISGLFLFVLVLAIFAAQMSGPTGWNELRESLKAQQRSDAEINQMMEVLRSPAGITAGIVAVFLLVTSLPAFGGAICAKLFPRRD